MSRTPSKTLALGLVACCVALNGWLLYLGVGHTVRHAHHSAAGHADPLCTWVCSAGQSTHETPTVLPSASLPSGSLETTLPTTPLPEIASPIFSRGPPLLFA